VVLDASAVIALARGERGASAVESVIDRASLSAVNFAETLVVLVRAGVARRSAVASLRALQLRIEPCDETIAEIGADIHAATRKHGLSLADCICLATARQLGAKVLTADRAWRSLDVGVTVEVIR
jgi:PIN domain nuclease of toxin-antitoxin system